MISNTCFLTKQRRRKKKEGEDGKKHGQGTYTWFDGGIYVGKWKDGKEHGQGTYTSHVGTKYVGMWKNGFYDVQGIFTLYDGNKVVGEFKKGTPWNTKLYDKNWKYLTKYVNGVLQGLLP